MRRWYLDYLRRALRAMLLWVNRERAEVDRPRLEKPSLLNREIEIPVPLITFGCAAVLFIVLMPVVGFTWSRFLGLAGLVGLLTLFFVLYFQFDMPELAKDDEAVLLTGCCLILGILIIEVSNQIPHYLHVAPVGIVTILVTLLLHIRLAFLMSVVLSIAAGILNNFAFESSLLAFLSSMAAMLSCYRARERGHILRAGLHVFWVTALGLYGFNFFEGAQRLSLSQISMMAFLNAASCSLFSLGFLPFLESFFSRVTNITLLELGDFNRPLLRRLMVEAPGTYHHTLLVAALAEQAAEAIGANSLLCRVGMYYHDIGKLAHPEYFIENQTLRRSAKDKPERHDKLNPSISSLVIMSHVKEGVALAKAHNVPTDILKFIPQHHGTSLIKYFYMRALEENEEDQSLSAETFRYPGPRPRSKETVIGMLADSVEAASRTLEEPTYERLKDLVEKIVNSKLTDGQFDEAPITTRDLRKIIQSFSQSLSAIYHVRIEYPEMKEPSEGPRLPSSSS